MSIISQNNEDLLRTYFDFDLFLLVDIKNIWGTEFRTPHNFLELQRKDRIMEKEMLALAKFKSKDGMFEKFMGWMQSDEGIGVRKSIAHVEKTVPAIAPDKSYVMFKVSVHNEEEMKKFASGNNPIAKPIFDECIEVVQMYELSKVKL